MSEVCLKGMTLWKNYFVVLTIAVLIISFPIFLVTGYAALYWTWLRGNLQAALPYVPWARNFGMAAMASAGVALGILFSSNTFSLRPKTRLWLSLLATVTIAFFSEFRNEGKFHLKTLVHFFGPGTGIYHAVNHSDSSLGDFLYRVEYSHWNDFLMGPAIVSVLFSVVFTKIYGAFRNQGPISFNAKSAPEVVPESLNYHEYTVFQRHMRPVELLILAGAMWWGLNRSTKHEPLTRLSTAEEEPDSASRWDVLITMAWVFGVPIGYLLILGAALSIVDPQGLGWLLATAAVGMLVGTAVLLLLKRAERQGFTKVFGRNDVDFRD